VSALVISRLTKAFGHVQSVKGIDLSVGEGEFVVLLGPSGCGKSTTLRMLAGLEYPTSGQIELGSQVLADPAKRVNVPPNKRRVGLVFQSYALWPHLSVIENVAFPLRSAKVGRAQARAEAGEFLELVGLSGYEDRPSMSLSGGQQQRVALARALVARPELLLLDEPLSNLDATLRVTVRNELRRIHRETARTTVYVTHDQAEALALADRIVLMNHGLIEQVAAPEELFERPATPFAAAFVGFENLLPGTLVGATAGGARVDLGGLGATVVAGSPPEGPGTVAFRAQDATLVPAGTEDALVATVADVVYTGRGYDIDVAADGTHVLVSHSVRDTAPRPAIGETVAVRVDPGRALWYQRTAGGEASAPAGQDPALLATSSVR
jgi:iron(III) transport system ATP-binding protein